VTLPADVKSKEDAQKALGEAAAAHKAELLKAVRAAQVIHRELAAKALAACGDAAAAIPVLGPVLGAEPDEGVRVACARTLGELKDAAALPALLRGLQDTSETVRCQAAHALGEVKDNRARQPLLDALAKDEKPSVRRRAANALAEIKDLNSLEGLLKALEGEQDYRVRMAIAGAVRAIRGKDPAAEALDQQEHDNILTALSKDMRTVEDKLRSDRHDQAVQVEQKEIEDKLNKLIEKVEQMQQQASSSSQQKQQQQQQSGQRPQQQQQQPAGARRPNSPMPDSKVGGGAERGALNPAEVASRQAEWAKLPPSMREELMQVYREGMPERWRLRLMAYYKSLAEEEVQGNK
jgi:HEAT repeat protein